MHRPCQFGFRVSTEELATIQRAAARTHRNPSDWARLCVLIASMATEPHRGQRRMAWKMLREITLSKLRAVK